MLHLHISHDKYYSSCNTTQDPPDSASATVFLTPPNVAYLESYSPSSTFYRILIAKRILGMVFRALDVVERIVFLAHSWDRSRRVSLC